MEVFNDVAKKALPSGVEYVEVFDLYGRDELDSDLASSKRSRFIRESA